MENKDVKIRYKPKDYERLKKKAKKSGLSINEYQKTISKKAKVNIELEEDDKQKQNQLT